MNFKKTIILFILLVALIIVALIIENPFSKKTQQKSEEEIALLFPDFKMDNAAKIEIKQMGSEFILEKKEGNWVVSSSDDFSADEEAVEKLLESVRDFKVKDIVSKNPENQNQFQVNDLMGIGTKVSDFDGNILAHVYVGKNGPNFLSTYIRKEGTDQVILEEGYLKTIFDKSRTSWKDMHIFNTDKELIEYFRLESSDGVIVCEKDENENWLVKEPETFNADNEVVDKITDTLATLSTNDYMDKKELSEYSLDKPERNLVFRMKDKKEYKLIISKEDKNKYYAKKPESDLVYSLYKYRINNIFKKLDEFRIKEAEEENAEGGPANLNPGLNNQMENALIDALKKQGAETAPQ